jgi:DNA-binding NtrC family response regulator
MSAPYILVVDDEPDIRTLVQEILEDEGYEVVGAEDAKSARAARAKRLPDLVLLDIWMPDEDGITLLKEWKEEERLPFPVIMMSGHGTVETAVEATRLGALDFVEKPLSLAKLLLMVKQALEAGQAGTEAEVARPNSRAIPQLVGESQTMMKLRSQAQRVARHDTPLLLTGEPGAGKKTLARFIHASGSRSHCPFIEINLGGLTEENAAVELYGRVQEGRTRPGQLQQAAGGTLLLYDLADLTQTLQAYLFDLLESGRFTPVGTTDSLPADVRLIVTTRESPAYFQGAKFREDLYYRLNVLQLQVPGLREHREDIPALLEYYADWFVKHEGLGYRHFNVAAQNRLRNHDWPGNVQELKNLVQRLMILGSGVEIGAEEAEVALKVTADATKSRPWHHAASFGCPAAQGARAV